MFRLDNIVSIRAVYAYLYLFILNILENLRNFYFVHIVQIQGIISSIIFTIFFKIIVNYLKKITYMIYKKVP